VIDLQGLFRSGFLTWATRAPIRIGFEQAREGARFFYTHRIPAAPENTHAVDRNYAVASMLGFADVPVQFPLIVPDSARTSAGHMISTNSAGPQASACANHQSARDYKVPRATGGLSASASEIDAEPQASACAVDPDESHRKASYSGESPPMILIAPGARGETKRWSADRFVEVIDSLTKEGVRCVLTGGRDEQNLCASIAASCRAHPINLAGQSTLSELVALVDVADVVLCHDSALAHIAVARDKPVVCITGPTNPDRTGPYRGGIVVRESVDCAPCYFRHLSQCPHEHRCMRGLSPRRVEGAVRQALRSVKGPDRQRGFP